ncbi:MAG: hypothetical protein DHS20C01_21700 [marine bacterium B5-7]|nr:MAG: hypothetical protein DHS20C01_21700 [marine bacterium B5-7]
MTQEQQPSATNRRKLIKALTIGGVAAGTAKLPEQWAKPVVESIVLPAHAQTTQPEAPPGPDLGDGYFLAQGSGIALQQPDDSILDYFARPAHAQDDIDADQFVVGCVSLKDGKLYIDSLYNDITGDGVFCLLDNLMEVSGVPLGGSQSLNIGSEFDLPAETEDCDNDFYPATVHFDSISGQAPNRMVTIRLVTAATNDIVVCQETDKPTCESAVTLPE